MYKSTPTASTEDCPRAIKSKPHEACMCLSVFSKITWYHSGESDTSFPCSFSSLPQGWRFGRTDYGSRWLRRLRSRTCHPEHDAWTGMGKNQEVYVAELHTHLPCYAHAFQEPRGQKITIFADAQAALQRIASDTPGPGQRYALAIAQQAHDLWEQRRVSVQFRWVPSHAGTTGNEKADEWTKMAARNGRGSEQLPYHVPGPPEALGITERKWVEACSWMESRLSKHHAYRPRKRMRSDPTPAKASKAVTSRSYLPAQDGARPHRAVPQEDRQARQRHLLVVRPRS